MPKPSASYKIRELKIPAGLVEPIQGVTSTPGTWQRPFQHLGPTLHKVGNEWFARAREPDFKDMEELAQNPKAGSYQKWSLEILEFNDIAPSLRFSSYSGVEHKTRNS